MKTNSNGRQPKNVNSRVKLRGNLECGSAQPSLLFVKMNTKYTEKLYIYKTKDKSVSKLNTWFKKSLYVLLYNHLENLKTLIETEEFHLSLNCKQPYLYIISFQSNIEKLNLKKEVLSQ